MPWNQSSQNGNGTYDNSYPPSGPEKGSPRRLLLIVVSVLVAIIVILLLIHVSQPESQQNKYTRSATAAAKKQIPNAKVTNVKVAGGFALATVSDPTSEGQLNAGNKTVFKVNKDGSMEQLANGSYISPLRLLELGIPLATQAKLTGSDVGQVKQKLEDDCGYDGGGVPGYSGFDGSFSPGGWQIDSATLSDLEQAVSDTISSDNVDGSLSKAVICINATQKNSNLSTDTQTYITTSTLQVQFVTDGGALSIHTLTFATGPNHYSNYTLDGHDISSDSTSD